MEGEWLLPAGASNLHCFLFLHGGPGPSQRHRSYVARIAKAGGTRALLLDYRRAPLAAAQADALAAYRWLLMQRFAARNVAIACDTSGVGLALTTAVAARETGLPAPGFLFCTANAAVVEVGEWLYEWKLDGSPPCGIAMQRMVFA
jgi:acetyl esterase/lipase